MGPSNSVYEMGWSSVRTASRFSAGSRLGPRVTAQLGRKPSRSGGRSWGGGGRLVLPHDEPGAACLLDLPSRLAGAREVPLLVVGFEPVGCHLHAATTD